MTVQKLVEAVQAGDLIAVQAILDARPELIGIDVSANNEHRALHYAVMQRDAEMVRLLMKAGADARKGIFPHRDATSAIAIAHDRGYEDILAIIEAEEQRRKENFPASSPGTEPEPDAIESAIAAGDAERVRELLLADPALLKRIGRNGGLLTTAVQLGQLEIARQLIELGADVDERIVLEELEEPTSSWGMPLWHAALQNRPAMVKLLLEHGADPNANVYASGWPLRNAWKHPDPTAKNLLLAYGAKMQPYMFAELHDAAAARRLLDLDASEEVASELTWSAAHHGCPEIVELAIARLPWPPADARWHWILIQPIRGAGPDGAANEGHFNAMSALLRHNIDPNVSRYGQTALHFAAAYHGSVSDGDRACFAAILLDAGARLDIRDDILRSTPLAWACRWGCVKLAKLLIARGAPLNEPDAEPWATPRAWARKMQHKDALELLNERRA